MKLGNLRAKVAIAGARLVTGRNQMTECSFCKFQDFPQVGRCEFHEESATGYPVTAPVISVQWHFICLYVVTKRESFRTNISFAAVPGLRTLGVSSRSPQPR